MKLNYWNLKNEILFECIIRKCPQMIKTSVEDYFTHEGLPKDYMQSALAEFRKATHIKYKGRDFYVVMGRQSACHIFYCGNVYYFETLHADQCEILKEIIQEEIDY